VWKTSRGSSSRWLISGPAVGPGDGHTTGGDAAVGGDAVGADDRAHASMHASFAEWSTDAPAACDAPDARGRAADDAPSPYGRFSFCELLDIFLLSFQSLET
jgi:hypothetical protein